jgi:aspartate racemase
VTTKPKHIGIAAWSAEGAALCYTTICVEGAARMRRHDHPEVSMHTHSLAQYMDCICANNWQGVADLTLSSAEKLFRIGADFLICPDNTMHRVMALVEPHSPLPWLHIAEEVALEAEHRGFRKVGVLGTSYLVESEVYPEKLAQRGITAERPGKLEREQMNRIILDELVCGIFRPGSLNCLQGVIEGLKRSGCEAVVLGCTEIPLLVNDSNSPLPTLDSTRILARAALSCALNAKVATKS